MKVREAKEPSCRSNGERLVCVQRVEPDAGHALLVVDIGSNVQFQEIGNAWQSGQKLGRTSRMKKGTIPMSPFAFKGIDSSSLAVTCSGLPWGRSSSAETVDRPTVDTSQVTTRRSSSHGQAV